MKLGLLDIGSNSIHLILVDIHKDLSVTILDRAKEFTRLGKSTFKDGKLSDDAMERGIAVIRRFKKLAEIRDISRIKAVATSAVREAKNGGDFIELIQNETAIKVKVITGEEEARLIARAVRHTIPMGKTPHLIVDIGGGSVELILANEKGVLDCISLKLGTQRMKEDFFDKDPPSQRTLNKASKHVASSLKIFFKRNSHIKPHTVIGTSGTILNLAMMIHWQTHTQALGTLNNYRLPASDFIKLHDKLSTSSPKDRVKLRGIDPQRNEIIVPGSAVFSEILKKWKVDDVILCENALREGLVYDYLERHRSKIEMESLIGDIRLRSILQLAKKCEYREKHAQQVTRLALSFFDQLAVLHEMGPWEREILQYASILHDIGYHISYKKHHRHTYYLIKNATLNGFESREIDLIANVARYHANSLPKARHENWATISKQDQIIVSKLAAILSIADALDRSHFSVVEKITSRIGRGNVKITAYSKSDLELELWAADKKKGFFEKTFDKTATLEAAISPKSRKRSPHMR